MDAPTEEHFFQVNLTQEGADHLLRLFRIIRWVFAGVVLTSTMFLVQTYYRWIIDRDYDFGKHFSLRLESAIIPYYSIVLTIVNIVFTALYFNFTRRCKKAIESGQTDLFNRSFRILVTQAILSFVTLIIELPIHTLFLYNSIYVANLSPAP